MIDVTLLTAGGHEGNKFIKKKTTKHIWHTLGGFGWLCLDLYCALLWALFYLSILCRPTCTFRIKPMTLELLDSAIEDPFLDKSLQKDPLTSVKHSALQK